MKKVTFILVACVKFVLKKLTFSILDPDPHCGSGSKRRNLGCLCKVCFKKAYFSHTGSRSALRIQIQTAKFLLIHADSDPKHFRLTMSTLSNLFQLRRALEVCPQSNLFLLHKAKYQGLQMKVEEAQKTVDKLDTKGGIAWTQFCTHAAFNSSHGRFLVPTGASLAPWAFCIS